MAKEKKFTATIRSAGGGGCYVEIPFDVEETFGAKRVKVQATIDGELYRGTLVRMGGPTHILVVLKAIREKIGKGVGESVRVVIREDTEPRVVTVPDDLQSALHQSQVAADRFAALSYTHQREYVQWIEEAKRQQTRQRRIATTIDRLEAEGVKA